MKKTLDITFKSVIFLILVFSLFTSLTSRITVAGLKSYVVMTGSMEPFIKTKSLIYTIEQKQYSVGDVITFKRGDEDITHRIVSVSNVGGLQLFQTKGDANKSADPQKAFQTSVTGKVILSLPLLGYLVLFMRTIPGFVLFIFIPALLLVVQELKIIKGEIEKETEVKLLTRLQSSKRSFGGQENLESAQTA